MKIRITVIEAKQKSKDFLGKWPYLLVQGLFINFYNFQSLLGNKWWNQINDKTSVCKNLSSILENFNLKRTQFILTLQSRFIKNTLEPWIELFRNPGSGTYIFQFTFLQTRLSIFFKFLRNLTCLQFLNTIPFLVQSF